MKTLKNKQGMALLTVMIILLVMVTLLGALLISSKNNLDRSIDTQEHTTTYYASEAGMTMVASEFEEKLIALSEQSPSLSASAFMTALNSYVSSQGNQDIELQENNGDIPKASVSIVYTGVEDGYESFEITSVGHYGGYDRTLVTQYKFEYIEGESSTAFQVDKAVMVKENIELSGSAEVTGAPVSTYQTTKSTIDLQWSTKVPAIELDPSLFNSNDDLIKTDIFNDLKNINNKITEGGLDAVKPLANIFEFPPIVMPTYPDKSTLAKLPAYSMKLPWGSDFQLVYNDGRFIQNSWNIDGSVYRIPDAASWYYVPEFIISAGNDFSIDVGNTDKFLVVDKLQLNGQVSIIGEGTLTIFVTGNTEKTASKSDQSRVELNYTSSNPVGAIDHPEKFIVYVNEMYYKSGNKTYPINISIGGSAKYYMSLMGANFNYETGGSGSLYGYVVTGGESVKINGAGTVDTTLFYVPNAEFEIAGSGYINGAVIAKSFNGTGASRVNFSAEAFDNFPFEVLDPITGGSTSSTPSLTIIKGSTIEQ